MLIYKKRCPLPLSTDLRQFWGRWKPNTDSKEHCQCMCRA